MKSSWRTTLAGIGAILVAVGAALGAAFDSNAATTVDIASLTAACMAGLGLIFARDNVVSSETAGAR
jgi:hypothetical protein